MYLFRLLVPNLIVQHIRQVAHAHQCVRMLFAQHSLAQPEFLSMHLFRLLVLALTHCPAQPSSPPLRLWATPAAAPVDRTRADTSIDSLTRSFFSVQPRSRTSMRSRVDTCVKSSELAAIFLILLAHRSQASACLTHHRPRRH